MFNVETYMVVGVGKGKTPMSEESLRRPTHTLSKPLCSRRGTLFVIALWISGGV
jgi:hypothetical protein